MRRRSNARHSAKRKRPVKASLEDVRRTAQELRPEVLDHLDLPSALTNLARTFSDRTGIPVRRQLPAQLPRLDPSVELVLYRVAQEGLTNAARHSGASEVTLTLEHDADSVVLRVLDNGRGFDGRTPPKAAACAASASAR